MPFCTAWQVPLPTSAGDIKNINLAFSPTFDTFDFTQNSSEVMCIHLSDSIVHPDIFMYEGIPARVCMTYDCFHANESKNSGAILTSPRPYLPNTMLYIICIIFILFIRFLSNLCLLEFANYGARLDDCKNLYFWPGQP